MSEPEFRPIESDSDLRHDALVDVVEGLAEWFTPADDDPSSAWQFRSDLDEHGELTNGRVLAVAWRYAAQPRASVWGVAADRGTIAIDGVSFLDLRDGEAPQVARYIDWHGAFVQLGVAAAGHVVVTEPGSGDG